MHVLSFSVYELIGHTYVSTTRTLRTSGTRWTRRALQKKRYIVVKVTFDNSKSTYKKQMALLPWGQHHHSLPSHQEVPEAPKDGKKE